MANAIVNNVCSPDSTELVEDVDRSDKKMDLLKEIQIELDKHKMKEALEILKNVIVNEVKASDSSIVWDLVPVICQRLRGLSKFRFKTFKYCQQMLLELADVCNPRELLILYLSELENDLNIARINGKNEVGDEDEQFEIVDNNCFKALLKPFEKVLLLMPKKRNESLKSVLISLNEHVSRLCVRPLVNLDSLSSDREKLLNDDEVLSLHSVVSHYVHFLQTFVGEVDIHQKLPPERICKSFDPNTQRTLLLRTLIRLLDYPLKFMHFAPSLAPLKNTTESGHNSVYFFLEEDISLSTISLKVIRLMSCLHSNFYTLITRHDLITSSEEENNNEDFNDICLSPDTFQSGISVAAYLLSIEPDQRPMNFVPLVYTHSYNLFVHIPMIKILLDNNSFFVYDKGLELLENLLLNIPQQTMDNKFLELIRSYPIDKSLVSIMVYSTDEPARKRALCLFRHLVIALDSYGRFKFLYILLSQPKLHSGFQALIVQTYKDLFFYDETYQKANLHKMTRTIINAALPEDIKTDILANNDLIFAALNFFRFVFLGDKKEENTTKIWDIVTLISDHFLKPLQLILQLNRDTYKLRLSKLKEMKTMEKPSSSSKRKARKSRQNAMPQVTTLQGELLAPPPEMPIEQEHKVVLMAMQNMDLIESVLVRVQEIIAANGSP